MLGLIAGSGDLPRHVAAQCASAPVVAAIKGFDPNDLTPNMCISFETLGSDLEALRAWGVKQVCFVGGVRRPQIDVAQIDELTMPLIERIKLGLAQGDDAALRVIVSVFEDAGFEVLGASQVAPDLVATAGFLTDAKPTDADRLDAERGAEIIAAMGQVDVGQACVVASGQALAIEALPGTDWMLRSLTVPVPARVGETGTMIDDFLGGAADWLSATPNPEPTRQRDPSLPPGGILVKAPKPGQSLLVDMPTVGPETVDAAAIAGLRGIVVAAGQVLMLEREELISRANAAGLFLWAREASQ